VQFLVSCAGKYVPSISHYIVQAQAMNDGTADELKKFRELPEDVEAPVFKFGGLAIGNGFTGECSRAGVTQLTLMQQFKQACQVPLVVFCSRPPDTALRNDSSG